ncbi:MAG: hypothetical protein OHK0046_29400 [Anaerolineae bacterium]
MKALPVREIVLYKHGVGFFIRRGQVDSSEISLTFHRDEINDVLKSLTIFDHAGGQVLGVHYPTPMDRDARLANSSVRLNEDASMATLLRDLRGRQVTLGFQGKNGQEAVTGRVVGMDQQNDELDEQSVSVLTEQGEVRIFRFEDLRTVHIHDAESRADLAFFLDTIMGEDDRRTVYVRLTEGQHDLFVAYVAPAPTWRVSYRIVATSESDDNGKALLQGWGLFDNRLEEDLDSVQVTLVAGQPISFVYELYASRIPQRRVVEDETRIAPGPVEYMADKFSPDESAILPFRRPAVDDTGTTGAARRRATLPKVAEQAVTPGMNRLLDRVRALGGDGVQAMATPEASTRESGEFFEYTVKTPVSIKRGESALVPIISSEVHYTRELLYNSEKFPTHPVASLRFENGTGLTLERGPITILENNDYRGEAIVAFTKDGNQVYLPYAVEMGVRVTEHKVDNVEVNGVNIEGAFLVYEEYQIERVNYILENTTSRALVITIEAPTRGDYELFDTPDPAMETARERRWRVELPPHTKREFTRKERQMQWRHQELRRLDYSSLQRFLENRWLDQGTYDQLADMLSNLTFIIRARVQREDLADERRTLYEQQEQLRANLTTLQTNGPESGFRNRLLKQLEESQDRLDEIEKTVDELTQQITEAERRIDAIIEGLGKKTPFQR